LHHVRGDAREVKAGFSRHATSGVRFLLEWSLEKEFVIGKGY
jgi:hypothetical protein